jgi:hypothetical protein
MYTEPEGEYQLFWTIADPPQHCDYCLYGLETCYAPHNIFMMCFRNAIKDYRQPKK